MCEHVLQRMFAEIVAYKYALRLAGAGISAMDIIFDRGSRDQPKGHALLYFRSDSDPDEVWVTYVVILPISVDVTKYVPPFLMDQVAQMGPKELSAFAFPPRPGAPGELRFLAGAGRQAR